MGHLQRKCSLRSCRAQVPTGHRLCPACGGRDSVWIARYRGPDHVERSKTFHRKIDAEGFVSNVEHDKNVGDWTDPERANITLAEFWSKQRTRPSKRGAPAPTTLAKWDTVWRLYLDKPLGSHPLAAITRQDVRDTIAAVPSPWQGAEALKLLRMLLYRAIDDNRL